MSLRWKVSIALLLMFAVTTVATQFLHRHIVYASYERLEQHEAELDLSRCTAAIDREVKQLSIFCRTWSAWDDACEFVQRPTDKFIRSNMVPESYVNNDVDLIWWLDPEGKCVWGQSRDSDNGGQPLPMPEFPALAADPANHLWGFTAPRQETAGLLITSRGPMLIVAQPIVTAENKGPIRGTVIQGRLVRDDDV